MFFFSFFIHIFLSLFHSIAFFFSFFFFLSSPLISFFFIHSFFLSFTPFLFFFLSFFYLLPCTTFSHSYKDPSFIGQFYFCSVSCFFSLLFSFFPFPQSIRHFIFKTRNIFFLFLSTQINKETSHVINKIEDKISLPQPSSEPHAPVLPEGRKWVAISYQKMFICLQKVDAKMSSGQLKYLFSFWMSGS